MRPLLAALASVAVVVPAAGVQLHAPGSSAARLQFEDAAASSAAPMDFTHFFNYFQPSDTPHRTEIRLVMQSWETARGVSEAAGLLVEHLACVLEGDSVVGLPGFIRKAPITLRRFARTPDGKRLPSMAELWRAAVEHGRGRFLIYTNVDIGLYPTFYEEMDQKLRARPQVVAYSVTKVVLPPVTGDESLGDLPAYITQQNVTQHMGHDCFVLARDRVPDVFLDNSLIIGSPPWGARALPCCHRSSWTPALLLALVPMRSCARRSQGPCTPWSCTGALGAWPLST